MPNAYCIYPLSLSWMWGCAILVGIWVRKRLLNTFSLKDAAFLGVQEGKTLREMKRNKEK